MTRLTAAHRRAQIIAAAHKASTGGGLYRWTLADISRAVGIRPSACRRYFTSAIALRRAVIIETGSHDLISQAITACDPVADDIPVARRRAAMRWLVSQQCAP